jgi:hypothetical protein
MCVFISYNFYYGRCTGTFVETKNSDNLKELSINDEVYLPLQIKTEYFPHRVNRI